MGTHGSKRYEKYTLQNWPFQGSRGLVFKQERKPSRLNVNGTQETGHPLP